jgi:hypothetical protein
LSVLLRKKINKYVFRQPEALPPIPGRWNPGRCPGLGYYRAFSPFSCQDDADGGMSCPFRLVLFLSVGKIRKFSGLNARYIPAQGNALGFLMISADNIRLHASELYCFFCFHLTILNRAKYSNIIKMTKLSKCHFWSLKKLIF